MPTFSYNFFFLFVGMLWQWHCQLCHQLKWAGLVRDLNPGPLAPEARIIPLDQRANMLLVCWVFEQIL